MDKIDFLLKINQQIKTFFSLRELTIKLVLILIEDQDKDSLYFYEVKVEWKWD